MRPILIAAAFLLLTAAPAFAADPVEGEWLTQAATAKVKIAPCAARADRMCGTVVWLKSAGVKDTGNPDPNLRGAADPGDEPDPRLQAGRPR